MLKPINNLRRIRLSTWLRLLVLSLTLHLITVPIKSETIYLHQIGEVSMNFGTSGTVLATANSSSTTGSIGNSWNVSTQGRVNLGLLYNNQAFVRANSGQLQFGNIASGLLQPVLGLLGTSISLNMHSTATKQVANTGLLTNYGQDFAYTFDLDVRTGLLSLQDLSLLNSIHVIARSGTTEIAKASLFGELLTLTDLAISRFDDVEFHFKYDPTTGPLNITWEVDVPLSAEVIQIFESSLDNVIYTVSNPALHFVSTNPIPEPGSQILAVVGFVLLIFRRRSLYRHLR